MFIVIAAVLAALWLVGVVAFSFVGGLIHLLLIVAFISILMHFVSRPRHTV